MFTLSKFVAANYEFYVDCSGTRFLFWAHGRYMGGGKGGSCSPLINDFALSIWSTQLIYPNFRIKVSTGPL